MAANGIDENLAALLNGEISQIEFLWSNKHGELKNDEKKLQQAWSKIAEILGYTLRVLRNASTKNHPDLTLKCLELCYYVGKNKTGREQLIANNGLEIFKQAAQICVARDHCTPMTKDLDAIICSLCLRCIPLKPLPVSKPECPVSFNLPETEACRCPAEEASESDEDNLIEVGPSPDVSEDLAAKLKLMRSSDDDQLQRSSPWSPHLHSGGCGGSVTVSFSGEATITVSTPAANAIFSHQRHSLTPKMSTVSQSPIGLGDSTVSQPSGKKATVNQTFDPTAAAACNKCATVADLENYRKFCAEFGDELMPPVVKAPPVAQQKSIEENPSSNTYNINLERNYATIGSTAADYLRPGLRRASRSTLDIIKKMEPRLTVKNRCSSEQKFNRDFLRRTRNASDPHPESADASPERSIDSRPGSGWNLSDSVGTNGGSKSTSEPAPKTVDDPQSANRKHCYYTAKTYAEAAKSVKHVSQFVKLAYPDYISAYPYLPLQPFKEYRQALLRIVLKEVEKNENNDFEQRTVYDLDELLANEKEPHELTNLDEEKAGIIDPHCDHLKFESRFECGNLRKAIQVGSHEYELILSNDINQILQHYMWFYFEVSNVEQDVPYVFKIINFVKSKSLVSTGMQPCVFSVCEAKHGRFGWARCGSGDVYFRNNYVRPSCTPSTAGASGKRAPTSERCFNTSTFTVSFRHRGDVSYIAFHYPYSYTSLKANLIRWQKLLSTRAKTNPAPGILYRKDVLCHTMAGNPVHLLTITTQGTGEQIALRDVIVLTSRVHPGESNASWMMQGTVDYLLSDNPVAQQARDLYVFKLIPMLNPDGVINGNHRCSLAGQDLNRQWLVPSLILHPSIYHAKNLLLFLRSVGKKPLVFCDYHGHSRKKNVFVYGNNPELSWRKEDRNIRHDWEFYLLPEILEENAAGFCLKYCAFQIQKGKECSARVNAWREMGIERSYTMEASYGGFDRGIYAGFQVGTRELIEMGEKLVESLVIMREYMDCNRTPTRKFESSDGDSDDSGLA